MNGNCRVTIRNILAADNAEQLCPHLSSNVQTIGGMLAKGDL